MRYLILSDIHANRTALDAALAAAKGRWDEAVCLGDFVGYGPDPNEVIDQIREMGAAMIRGNHDKASCGLDNAENFNPVARRSALWTREQLRPENREWLKMLPHGPVSMNGFSIVHGSLRDEDEYVFAPNQALGSLLDAFSPVTFFGHTHVQGGFSMRDEKVAMLHFRPAHGEPFANFMIERGTTYLLNPGSVGQPRDGDMRAAFAIANLEKNSVEFWRVSYQIEEVQKRMMDAGLPDSLVLRLAAGR